MKKLLTALMITVLSSAATFANTNPVNEKVLKTFNAEFTTASSVTWKEISQHGIFRASFINDDQQYEAFISEDGDLIATARTIAKKQLPIEVAASMEKTYGKNYIDNSIAEINMEGGTAYYVTVITDKATLIVKASLDGSLSVFKKQKSVAA
ncbi:MAG: hypothetical protein ABJA78_05725 [Ferruginibacter sp.]